MSKKYNYNSSLNEIIRDSFAYMRKNSYVREGFKGCNGVINKSPVSLEPSFKSYRCIDFGKQNQMQIDCNLYVPDDSVFNWRYLRIWFAKQDDEFKSQEAFKALLNSLGALGQKFKVTLGGNKERVSLTIGVAKSNIGPAKNAIAAIYPRSEIDISGKNSLFENLRKDNSLKFIEYFTPPPYWRSLSCPDQRFTASLLPCLCSEVGAGEAGFYELIIQPCRNDWGSNIFNLCNAEREGGVPLHVSRDWREAGFGNDYSDKTKQKINTPMYAAMIRVGAYCSDQKIDSVLKILSLPVVSLLWGGQRLKYIAEHDLINEIGEEKTHEIILNSETYRTGSLFSLDELSYLSPFFEKEDLIDPIVELGKASEFDNVISGSKNKVFVRAKGSQGEQRELDFTDEPLSEEQLTNSILRISRKVRNVYFLSGHNEYDIYQEGEGGLTIFRNLLIGNNIVSRSLMLGIVGRIPDDCDVLIVAGPKEHLDKDEIKVINDYLKNGGDALFLIENIFEHIVEERNVYAKKRLIVFKAAMHFIIEDSKDKEVSEFNQGVLRSLSKMAEETDMQGPIKDYFDTTEGVFYHNLLKDKNLLLSVQAHVRP